MKLQYVLGSCVGFMVIYGHFELECFASRIGRSEMECEALGFSYVRSKLKMDNSPKWVLFNVVSVQIASDAPWK